MTHPDIEHMERTGLTPAHRRERCNCADDACFEYVQVTIWRETTGCAFNSESRSDLRKSLEKLLKPDGWDVDVDECWLEEA